jgi:tRNA-specific 2-thiouridylase
MKKGTVFVGLSGGVDSAVSAALLKKQGYEVIGVFIKTWHPDFLLCNEEEERHDAMRVATHLDIPFLTFDFEDVYKKEVADYMISEYKAGRTPNPDVMCNKYVKFGAFLKKAISMGADYVATGHYAQIGEKEIAFLNGLVEPEATRGPEKKQFLLRQQTSSKNTGQFCLGKGIDPSKDQSYFLWTLKQEQLKRILFPVGYLKKTEVRKLANKFNLPVAEKKDSQGICFLGDIDLKEFLKHYIKSKKGKVLNEAGNEIGYHDGAVFHTLGERHGFIITKKTSNDGAYYIVGKDIKKNILIVSQSRVFLSPLTRGRLGGGELKFTSPQLSPYKGEGEVIQIKDLNWISKIPEPNKNYTAQIRYHGEFLSCKVICKSKVSAQVIFDKNVLIASGQSCVIYDQDICLGGGVVV